MRETVLKGNEYAHRISLPAPFAAPRGGTYQMIGSSFVYVMHRYGKEPGLPNSLIITAQPILLSELSPMAFVADANSNYSVRPAKAGEWSSSSLIDDGSNWRRSFDLRAHATPSGMMAGGKTYPTRTTDRSKCGVGASEDERLLMIRCALGGQYEVEVFDAKSQEHLASLNLDHPPDKIGWSPRYFQFLDNRWLAITLTEDLREILLFDFEPHFQGKAAR